MRPTSSEPSGRSRIPAVPFLRRLIFGEGHRDAPCTSRLIVRSCAVKTIGPFRLGRTLRGNGTLPASRSRL